MTQSNCKGCTKRYVGCHSNCDIYKAYRRNLDEQMEKRNKEREYENDFRAVRRRAMPPKEKKEIVMISEDIVLGFIFGVLMVVAIIAIATLKGWMKKCDEYEEEIYEDETSDCTISTQRYYIPECPKALECDYSRVKNPYINGTVRAMAWEEGKR